MEAETRRKIEETVIDILKKSELEELTELKVRVTASERLGIELTGIEEKSFVRSVVESFLLSTEEAAQGLDSESNGREETTVLVEEKRPNGVVPDRLICHLSKKKRVVIHDVEGQTYVTISKFYHKDGKQIPTGSGISLTTEQWSAFKKCVPATQEAVMKMEANLRSEPGMKNEDSPTFVSPFTPELVPFDTTRFDGKNYHRWAKQMELLLNQQKIAYVLTEPCPSLSPTLVTSNDKLSQAKAAERKWRNDDYICTCNILNSLSDHLFYQYSKKTKSAKELWEELRLVYLYEEYGTKRSHVKKYIEYQMVDGKSILDQIQELNNIADSIVAAGMLIDENFHVSSIISKLPPSWKDFYIKLVREENLPFWALMDHLKAEEESRNRNKQGVPSNPVSIHSAKELRPRLGNMKQRNMCWKREPDGYSKREPDGYSKREQDGYSKREPDGYSKSVACYTCGRMGHRSSSCTSRR